MPKRRGGGDKWTFPAAREMGRKAVYNAAGFGILVLKFPALCAIAPISSL